MNTVWDRPLALAVGAFVVVMALPICILVVAAPRPDEDVTRDAFERGRQRGIAEEQAQLQTLEHCEQLVAASMAWDRAHPRDGGSRP